LAAYLRDGIEEQCAHEKALILSVVLGSQRQKTGFSEAAKLVRPGLKWSSAVEYLLYMKGKIRSHVPPRSKALLPHKPPSRDRY
jgi:hypothetical protein